MKDNAKIEVLAFFSEIIHDKFMEGFYSFMEIDLPFYIWKKLAELVLIILSYKKSSIIFACKYTEMFSFTLT